MAHKLNVDTGGTHLGKKIWERHQADEYLKVSNYKEGFCFKCESKNAVAASIFEICQECMDKRGLEYVLARVGINYYGMCNFCGIHKYKLHKVNIRLCQSCMSKVTEYLSQFRKGYDNVDPFWKSIKRRNGKDWKLLFSDEWSRML